MPWWVGELELAKQYQSVYRGDVDLGTVAWRTRAMLLAEARSNATTKFKKPK